MSGGEKAALCDALESYDGRHKRVLEELQHGLEPSPAMLRAAVDCAVHERAETASGATWLLREWLKGGASADAKLVGRVAALLPEVEEPWAALHLCRIVRLLELPKLTAPAFAAFFERWRAGPRPFVRAWAIDGLVHLSDLDEARAAAADRALLDGMEDSAASVRARVRALLRGR